MKTRNPIRMKLAVGTLMLTLFASVGFAEPVYVWTGAVDGKWMEPGNWTVKGSDPAVSPTAADLAEEEITVEFGPIANGHTTIDLTGVGNVSNVLVVAGAPKYTFGTSADQTLLQSQPGGLFEVRSGAAAPHVVAQFGWDEVWNTETVGFTVVNNADDVLVLDQAFVRPSGATKSYFLFSGTGDIRIDGTATTASPRVRLGLTEGARLVWNAVGKTFEKFEATVGADGVLELGKDVTITCGGGYYKFQVGDNKGAARLCVTGEGALEFGAVPKSTARTGGGLYMDGPINVGNADSVLTLDVDMLSTYYKAQDYYASAYFNGPAGSAVIVRTNELRGCVKLLGSSSGACLSVASIGLGKEVPSFLGYADILAAGNNVLRYTGPGETCDRSLFITNKAPVQANQDDGARDQKAQIWQDGTGPLVWQGAIDAPGMTAESTLTLGGSSPVAATLDVALANSSAGGAFALTKAGTGTWRLGKSNTYTGTTTVSGGTLALGPEGAIDSTSGITLSGGSLTIEGADSARTVSLPAVTLTKGTAALTVKGDTTLTLASLTRTGGTLNVVPDDAATVKLTGLAGQTPAWLQWKGAAASVGNDGTVGPSGVMAIAARGDVVPDEPGTVAIVRLGSGENTKLAKEDVTVGKLQQMIQSPATIAIGEGETLTAGTLGIAANSGDLTIGVVAGQGTVTGMSKLLSLTSESPDAAVTVKAALGSATNRLTAGAATLAGGTATTADLRVSKGVLKLTGEKTFKFDSISVGRKDQNEATIVLDGAKDVQFGDGGFLLGLNDDGGNSGIVPVRMVITNSTLTSFAGAHAWTGDNDDFGTFVIGRRRNAILEVQAGALISNVLCVGVMPVSSNTDRWFTGLLRQTGGEVRPASGRPTCGIGGRYGNATYLMEGGLLQPVGEFNIGNYSEGTLDLRAGTAIYPAGIALGGCNGAYGLLRACGGTMTVASEMTLASAGLGGWGCVLLEDDAFVSVRSVYMTIPNANYTCRGVVALNGGVFETTGFNVSMAPTETKKVFLDVGFGGGTLRTKGTYNDIFHYGTGAGTPRVTVYAGGCTVDTNGKNGNFTVEPFAGPTGKGVAGVTMPAESYTALCEPFIEITGDGYGALAVPIWDYETLTFSGVRIVQPGYGYTWAKISAIKSSNTWYFQNVDCELADNVNTGSFTKAGEGNFIFKAANTYGGDTVLRGGTLTADVEGAIPSGSTVVFAGGTLTLGVDVPAPTRYAADYAAALQGTPATGGYVFPDGATITVRNVPADDLPARIDLLSLGAGYAGPRPTLDLTGVTLPKGYAVRWVGNKLRLSQPTGLMMILR